TICVESRAVDETWRAELSEFIAIPSVSAVPAHREDVKRAGEWVCDFIRRIGGTAELTPFGEKELALGEIRASTDPENAPTVLIYGHFDVQPPAPLELWESDPFELSIRDEWAYARGVTDDKGQVYILLKAAQKLVEAKALPVNLRFACDGEEEIGGHTIVDWIEIDDRGAQAAVIFDGGMVAKDIPAFELSTRGLIAYDVKVRTGERDLHSGMYGGAALNAIHVLMRCFDAVVAGPDGLLPAPLPRQAPTSTWPGQERRPRSCARTRPRSNSLSRRSKRCLARARCSRAPAARCRSCPRWSTAASRPCSPASACRSRTCTRRTRSSSCATSSRASTRPPQSSRSSRSCRRTKNCARGRGRSATTNAR